MSARVTTGHKSRAMIKRSSNRILSCCASTFILMGCATGLSDTATKAVQVADARQSEYVGRYNGNSFETAMGMELTADGKFQWGLSVGALDMRAEGTWNERDGTVLFTSDPVPVPPRLYWLGLENNAAGDTSAPMVKVMFAETGKPFGYADVMLTCGDGSQALEQIPEEGWSPEAGACRNAVSMTVQQSMYDLRSDRFDLAEMGWQPGRTIRIAFEPNDIGVMDLTGMTGHLNEGILTVDGPLGREKFRKMRVVPPEE